MKNENENKNRGFTAKFSIENNLQKSLNAIENQKYGSGLYVVSTPIGNLGDITLRAIWVLTNADEIYCEDTRTTANLLSHYNIIGKKLLKFTDHATMDEIQVILKKAQTQKLAIVSDAGTPLICDPGQSLVKQAQNAGVGVFSINGCSSPIAALSVCGVECENFAFLGFFDKKKFEKLLAANTFALQNFDAIVFFDNAKSLEKSLSIFSKISGISSFDVKICLELTKLNERVISVNYPSQLPPLKGELVCVLHNLSKQNAKDAANVKHKLTTNPSDAIMQILNENDFVKSLSTADKIAFLQKFYKNQIESLNLTKKQLYSILQQCQ